MLVDIDCHRHDIHPELAKYAAPPVYSREAFRAILARQP